MSRRESATSDLSLCFSSCFCTENTSGTIENECIMFFVNKRLLFFLLVDIKHNVCCGFICTLSLTTPS